MNLPDYHWTKGSPPGGPHLLGPVVSLGPTVKGWNHQRTKNNRMIETYSQTTEWNRSSALTLGPYFGECIGLTTELTPQATVGLLLLLDLTLSSSTSSSTSSSGAKTNCNHGSITIPKSNIRPRSNNQKQHLKPDKEKAREPRPRTQQEHI